MESLESPRRRHVWKRYSLFQILEASATLPTSLLLHSPPQKNILLDPYAARVQTARPGFGKLGPVRETGRVAE